MHTEIVSMTAGVSMGGAPLTRLAQIRVENTVYFIHSVDNQRLGGQLIFLFLGYQRDGMDMLFTDIPYDDQTFAWMAQQMGNDPTTELFVLIDGERRAVEVERLPAIETATMVGPVWCPVANVVRERTYGPGGKEIRRGSKHFAPGAKLYCYPSQWGDGYQQIQVLGRHRATHRYVKMIVSDKWLVNWRVQLVYSPHLIRELWPQWDGTERSHERAQTIVDFMRVRMQEREQSATGNDDA